MAGDRCPCPGHLCLRADDICCPDEVCDYELGLYTGKMRKPWWDMEPDQPDDTAALEAADDQGA